MIRAVWIRRGGRPRTTRLPRRAQLAQALDYGFERGPAGAAAGPGDDHVQSDVAAVREDVHQRGERVAG
ncbi:MAG TPA: hypothetical protein VGM14_02900 [Streptosporangiaceae bacterium]